jgi:hypothetical protein
MKSGRLFPVESTAEYENVELNLDSHFDLVILLRTVNSSIENVFNESVPMT